MSESISTELPSYEYLHLEDDVEDPPPPPLTPTASITTTTLPTEVAPDRPGLQRRLVSVRRATTIGGQDHLPHGDLTESPSRMLLELQEPISDDPSMQNATRAEVGEGDSHHEPRSIQQASQPTKNVEFTFSPLGTNAMLLLPPAEEHDTRPRYYITVIQNCFMPLSHITTIYRGASESALRVGEFEMGILASPGHRQMGNQPPESLAGVVTKKCWLTNNVEWTWPRRVGSVPPKLYWRSNEIPFICSTEPLGGTGKSNSTIIAWFTPRHTDNGAPTAQCRLQVSPMGQALFDDIVMSILVIERRILTMTYHLDF